MILWKIDFECEFSENINHLINFPSFWQNQGKFSIDWFFFSVFSALFGFDFFYWKCKSPSAAHANRLTYFSLAALLPPISRSYNRLDTEQSINERKCQYKSKMFSHHLLLCTCFSFFCFFKGGNMICAKIQWFLNQKSEYFCQASITNMYSPSKQEKTSIQQISFFGSKIAIAGTSKNCLISLNDPPATMDQLWGKLPKYANCKPKTSDALSAILSNIQWTLTSFFNID